MIWRTSRRDIELTRPLVMAILNVTPDSFSDGGKFAGRDAALRRAEKLISDGADILDIGGESTRPGSARVSADEETARVVPVIEAVARRFDVPISIDTSKSTVARAAIDAGAEIINDISGLRFDEQITDIAAERQAGLVLMHSRGEFETMHAQPPVEDILAEVEADFHRSISLALEHGVASEHIVLDVGIGFGKTIDQNLELIGKLRKLATAFPQFPLLIGASRKSFLGKILGERPAADRLGGSLVCAVIAVANGAGIVRVHDVKETADAIRVYEALRNASSDSLDRT